MERQYKDSGIEWIGRIPKEWRINKVNHLFGIIGSGTTPNSSDDDAFAGSINWLQSGDINGGIITNACKKISNDTLAKYSVLSVYKAPFIIVAMYGASVGNISLSQIDACVNQACCVLSDSQIDLTYAFYAIKSAQRYLIFRAVGGGQPNISQYTLRQLWIPEPSFTEQQRIADYLDKKCAEIDGLIELQEQMIAQLTDYKQSVITEAVTKGLNPNAELVPSGIDWIGEIPKGWEVCKLKYQYTLFNGRAYLDSELLEEGKYRILRVGNLFSSDKWYYSDMELDQNKYCVAGDLLYGWSASIGPYIWNQEKVIYHYHIWKINIGKNDLHFSYYMLQALTLAKQRDMHGSAMQHLTKNNMDNSKIAIPPLSEQQAIASYLDEKCSEIDSLIALKQQKIEALKDYKKSIIYEAVTGKC